MRSNHGHRYCIQCLTYIKEFGPAILQALLQDVSAKQICANYIHACPESNLLSNGTDILSYHGKIDYKRIKTLSQN